MWEGLGCRRAEGDWEETTRPAHGRADSKLPASDLALGCTVSGTTSGYSPE